MEEKPAEPPVCYFCGNPLSERDAEISDGRCCFDCAITYLAGAAHQMAEGIRAKKAAEEALAQEDDDRQDE